MNEEKKREKRKPDDDEDDHDRMEPGSSSSSSNSEDSEEDSIDSEDEEESNKEIQVDFEGCAILEQDQSGILRLLRQLFLKESINLSELTDSIIKQKNIGSIIRQIISEEDAQGEEEEDEDDEDEVFGLTTALDLSSDQHKSMEWHKSFREYLTTHLSGDKKSDIEKVLQDDNVKKVWIINLRFVNIDWRISIPSFEKLGEEIKASKIQPDYYLMICRILYPKKRYVKERKKPRPEREDVIFLNPEEEYFDEHADFVYEFDISSQCDSETMGGDWEEGDQEYFPCRRVLLFSPSSWTKANENLVKSSKT
ncbi:protein BCCIP homolog [Brevipalpus obovatus]|uniref:protein BCCIP homolog n=1 Tax=Brevipalpus obovatus TaxID=246614 RepID=UPI003D9E8E52